MKNLRVAFWGTSRFSVIVLDEMKSRGVLPELIVTLPAKPKGRKLELTPSDVSIWANANNIPTLEPSEIKSSEFSSTLGTDWDLFIVASYGKIIPRALLDAPKHGTLNVHPSLLPKLRGASPLQGAILEEVPVGSTHETGVSIMLIDEEVDHGPIVAQEKIMIPNWPPKDSGLEEILGKLGGKLLVEVIPNWMGGKITPTAQNHSEATYTKKITKESGRIDLSDNAERTYRKVRAFDVWPRTYFITERNGREMRVVVTDAKIEDGKLIPLRVIPEGKREMSYEEFLRGQK
ncbi:MAG: methionyl-tRNA formyltransferase [Patescibacteria group bacterium]